MIGSASARFWGHIEGAQPAVTKLVSCRGVIQHLTGDLARNSFMRRECRLLLVTVSVKSLLIYPGADPLNTYQRGNQPHTVTATD